MSALTWITNKELEREIKNKGDECRRKNHVIVPIHIRHFLHKDVFDTVYLGQFGCAGG